jgi:hypothetical protein
MTATGRSPGGSPDEQLPRLLGVYEPATFLTDLVLGGLSIVLGLRLVGLGTSPAVVSMRLWGWALVAMGVGAVLGGLSHGLGPGLEPASRRGLWRATLATLGPSSLLLLWGVSFATLDEPARTLLVVAAVIKLALYWAWLTRRDDFIVVIADHAPTMLIVLVLQAAAWSHGASSGAWVVAGVVAAMAGGVIQALRLAPGRWFNHNDLFHVVQMVSVWLFYEGGTRFIDHP